MKEMDAYIVTGGNRLFGETEVLAAKNAVLPIIACCIMIKGTVVLHGCEPLTDVLNMLRIVESLGGTCAFEGSDITVDCSGISRHVVGRELSGALRSSVFILGSLISRMRAAELSYPGGCDIGPRPIDLHLEGLRALGVELEEDEEKIGCDGRGLHSGNVTLAFPSVGATENLIMAATLTPGRTVIRNAAAEPEIVDLCSFITAMGGHARLTGNTAVVDGVERLHGGEYTPIADRIAAGTYLIAGAMCGGRVTVTGADSEFLIPVTGILRAAGAHVTERPFSLTVESDGHLRMIRRLETQPYPGFPTDLQAPVSAMMAVSRGRGYIIENLFENRYRHTRALRRMGADITICGRAATVRGRSLHGAEVEAEDLRGGAALVLAALKARGTSVITGLHHIDRGYYRLEDKLSALGGDIKRVKKPCV